MKAFAILFILFFSNSMASAQSSFRGSPFSSGFGLKGVRTYAGFGFADFEVQSPSSAFRMDKGTFAFVGGEKDLNDDGTSITISFNYMTMEGQAAYNYTTLGNQNYTGTDIGFDSTNYQLGLGLKQRFFPESWLRPYVEGGGLFGYHELKYTDNTSAISNPGAPGPKLKDALTGFGYYGEAGVELDFSEAYGVRIGGRYQVTETRKFETLGDQVLKFETFVFQFALLLRI